MLTQPYIPDSQHKDHLITHESCISLMSWYCQCDNIETSSMNQGCRSQTCKCANSVFVRKQDSTKRRTLQSMFPRFAFGTYLPTKRVKYAWFPDNNEDNTISRPVLGSFAAGWYLLACSSLYSQFGLLCSQAWMAYWRSTLTGL